MERKKYLMIDVETAPCSPSDGVDPYNMFVYDAGGAIVDRYGDVDETFSFIISDIFQAEAELMKSAYYADKIPMYLDQLANNERQMVSFYTLRKHIADLCEKYNVSAIIAHNARFDYGALQNTQRWLTKSKYRNFFPCGIEIWDTLKMARDTIGKQKTYIQWCKQNGYITKKGAVRMTAEILYRYISQDDNFIESHTGLEDVMIEKEIFAKCMAQHKKMRKKCFEK